MTNSLAPGKDRACLVVHGSDQAGLVAAIAGWILENDGNILSLDQYSDNPEGGDFLQESCFIVRVCPPSFRSYEPISRPS